MLAFEPVGDDVVLLEDREGTLWVHRLDPSNSTVWEVPLGVQSRTAPYGTGPARWRIDAERITVAWLSGEPSDEDGYPEPSTVMRTSLNLDGSNAETVALYRLPDRPATGSVWTLLDVDRDGSVVVGYAVNGGLVIRSFEDVDSETWQHESRGRSNYTPSLAATDEGLVLSTVGNTVTALSPDGTEAWAITVDGADYAAVTSVRTFGGEQSETSPAAVVMLTSPFPTNAAVDPAERRFWFCVVGGDGTPLFTTDLGPDPSYDQNTAPLSAWWSDDQGLIVFTNTIAMGTGYRLTSISTDGDFRSAVSMGGSGDVFPSEASWLDDISLDESGRLTLLGGLTERVGDGFETGDFDTWSYLIRFEEPGGGDPLAALPLQDLDGDSD
jgi:hypothetical protein